jgi:hypothetical protein
MRTLALLASLLFVTVGFGTLVLAPNASATGCGESCGCNPPTPCCPANVGVCKVRIPTVCTLDGPACLGYLACVTARTQQACVKDPCYHPECAAGANVAALPVCDPYTNDHWYAGYSVSGPACTRVSGYVCVQATYDDGSPGGPMDDFGSPERALCRARRELVAERRVRPRPPNRSTTTSARCESSAP